MCGHNLSNYCNIELVAIKSFLKNHHQCIMHVFVCRMAFHCTLLSSLGEVIKVGLQYPTGGLQHSLGQDCDKEEWPSWSEPK